MTLADLVARWQADAERLEELGQGPAAQQARCYADELETVLRERELEELTPTEAAQEEGCSPSTIRRRFPGRKTISRAELKEQGRGNVDGPDLAGALLRQAYHGGRIPRS
jgi:DNA-directed RNA polymerase specialized sigma24 family protein